MSIFFISGEEIHQRFDGFSEAKTNVEMIDDQLFEIFFERGVTSKSPVVGNIFPWGLNHFLACRYSIGQMILFDERLKE